MLVALEPCDMRKGFNGLHALVTERLAADPRGGTLFVFSNRRHTRLKILCWDGYGNREIMGRADSARVCLLEKWKVCQARVPIIKAPPRKPEYATWNYLKAAAKGRAGASDQEFPFSWKGRLQCSREWCLIVHGQARARSPQAARPTGAGAWPLNGATSGA